MCRGFNASAPRRLLQCQAGPDDESISVVPATSIVIAARAAAASDHMEGHFAYVPADPHAPVILIGRVLALIVDWNQQSRVTGEVELARRTEIGVDFAIERPCAAFELVGREGNSRGQEFVPRPRVNFRVRA